MRPIVTFVAAILLFESTVIFAADPVETTGRWDGKVEDRSLQKAAPSSGVIADSGAWKAISNQIEAKGKLSTGIMAIGGETTGTILTTNKGIWELDFGGNEKQRKLADKLNGQVVVVSGVLERRGGVEIQERRIIKVDSLEAAEDGADAEAALAGTVVIPVDLASFDDRILEVKLWQYDPFLADVSADLFDELVVKGHAHEAGTITQIKFELGKANAVREDRAYYLTVFITQDGKRTHMGEKDGKRGLCKVLNRGNPSTVKMIVREVGR